MKTVIAAVLALAVVFIVMALAKVSGHPFSSEGSIVLGVIVGYVARDIVGLIDET